MKKVVVYDSYRRVFDENNTLLHDASGSEVERTGDLSFEEACVEVNKIFEETKLLGTYTEIVTEPEKGVVEIKVEFPDKKQLHRVIYLKDSSTV